MNGCVWIRCYMYHKKILQRSYFRKIVLPISTQLYIVKRHTRKWDQGPGTSTGGTPGPLTRDPKMSKWDPRPGTPKWDPKPGTPKVGPRTRDPKIIKWNHGLTIFYSLIVYSTPNSSLVLKPCINQFIRLTYFVASIQKQPLRCVMNFKEL